MKYCLILLFLISHFAGFAQQPIDVLNSIKTGDWKDCTKQIENFYQTKSVHADTKLFWEEQPFNQLFNTYDGRSFTRPVISVSGFATKKNVWEYWDFWSQSLTNSTWKPKDFFKNKGEALLLAKYNVLVLLSHEFGHHLADRYRVDPENLNCKEFEADKISYGFEVWLSKDESLNNIQQRYQLLLKDINQHIDSNSKFEYKSYISLTSDCEKIDVKYPTSADLMPQYASAFFVRREALYYNKGQFAIETHLNQNHLKNDLIWKHRFPMKPVLCDGEYKIPNRYSLSHNTQFTKGIKKLYAWGEGFDQQIDLNGFAFDSSGQFVNAQVNINKLISPGDLWDFRFYDSSGSLVDVWYTIPPILDSVGYAKLQSVYINDVHNDLAMIVDLSPNNLKHNFYLLIPSKDKLTLDWHWLGTQNSTGMFIVDLKLSDSISLLSISSFEPLKHFATKENLLPINITQVSLPKSIADLKIDALAQSPKNGIATVFASQNYLMGTFTNDAFTLAGNGLDGDRFDSEMIEIPKIFALRVIRNSVYCAHEIKASTATNSILIRKLQLPTQ